MWHLRMLVFVFLFGRQILSLWVKFMHISLQTCSCWRQSFIPGNALSRKRLHVSNFCNLYFSYTQFSESSSWKSEAERIIITKQTLKVAVQPEIKIAPGNSSSKINNPHLCKSTLSNWTIFRSNSSSGRTPWADILNRTGSGFSLMQQTIVSS